MRFVCRYCRCYWTLTAPDIGDDSEDRILLQVAAVQMEQCPTMLNGVCHSLFGELE